MMTDQDPIRVNVTPRPASPGPPGPPGPAGPRGLLSRISHGWWVVICLVYVISPVDLMPELLLGPIIGGVDDAGIAAFAMYNLYRWFVERRRKSQTAGK
jgi:hypothetical protein